MFLYITQVYPLFSLKWFYFEIGFWVKYFVLSYSIDIVSTLSYSKFLYWQNDDFDGLVQDCSISIAEVFTIYGFFPKSRFNRNLLQPFIFFFNDFEILCRDLLNVSKHLDYWDWCYGRTRFLTSHWSLNGILENFAMNLRWLFFWSSFTVYPKLSIYPGHM